MIAGLLLSGILGLSYADVRTDIVNYKAASTGSEQSVIYAPDIPLSDCLEKKFPDVKRVEGKDRRNVAEALADERLIPYAVFGRPYRFVFKNGEAESYVLMRDDCEFRQIDQSNVAEKRTGKHGVLVREFVYKE